MTEFPLKLTCTLSGVYYEGDSPPMTLFCLVFLFLVSLLQLGPFVDSKHEQIEVSVTETVFFLILSVYTTRGNISCAFLHVNFVAHHTHNKKTKTESLSQNITMITMGQVSSLKHVVQ